MLVDSLPFVFVVYECDGSEQQFPLKIIKDEEQWRKHINSANNTKTLHKA